MVYKGNERHRLFAKPEGERLEGLIRSDGDDDSYAHFYLENIMYPDATSPVASKWVYKLGIQVTVD